MALKQAAKLENSPKSKKRAYLRAKYTLARDHIQMSQQVRSIDFNPTEKKRLVDKIGHTVERLHSLEREAVWLERRFCLGKAQSGASRKLGENHFVSAEHGLS